MCIVSWNKDRVLVGSGGFPGGAGVKYPPTKAETHRMNAAFGLVSASFPISLRKEDQKQGAFTWMDNSIFEDLALWLGYLSHPPSWCSPRWLGHVVILQTITLVPITHGGLPASLFQGLENGGSIEMDAASPHLSFRNPFHCTGDVRTGMWSGDALVLSHPGAASMSDAMAHQRSGSGIVLATSRIQWAS